MAIYHLSYDVKDSKRTNNDEFLSKITEKILSNFNPRWIFRPVASTIYFACVYDIDAVKSVLVKTLEKDAYYLLTKVEVLEGNPVRAWLEDPSLAENFAEDCKRIKEGMSK